MTLSIADTIYELLIGERASCDNDPIVENMFAEGRTCERLYDLVYQANVKLCERLGTQEDSDIETIINSLLEINKLVGKKMFEYGVQHGAGKLRTKEKASL